MNFPTLSRSGTALLASAAFFASVSSGAGATNTFNVSTTIEDSCSVTNAGPSDLVVTYVPTTDTSTGAATSLDTFCNGTSPTVSFSDGTYGTTNFAMTGPGGYLYYYLSQSTTCTGVVADNPIVQGFTQPLGAGTTSFDICAAVITGGVNTGAPAGAYSDTVTYSISP